MTSQARGRRIRAFALSLSLALTPFVMPQASAQAIGAPFSAQQPQLADWFDAIYVSQARLFEAIAEVDASPDAQGARDQFRRSLEMRANMSMNEMMAMMRMNAGARMTGPFDEWESGIASAMMEQLRSEPSRADVRSAYEDSPLPARAVELIEEGRFFENEVYEILADNSIADKAAALEDAVADYLSGRLSVPDRPKPAGLLLDHAYAGAFSDGYPRLRSLLWSTQWLQLAAIEAMILEEQDNYYWGSIDTVRERFRNKIADGPGADSPLPVELPMAPAIAPQLYTLSPRTAIVLDNLNMFETVAADTLTYPNLENKVAALDSLVDDFTNHAGQFDPTIDYLVSALRGGIYNQGGPAVGELTQSERNRSRMEMGMQHSMIMSTP